MRREKHSKEKKGRRVKYNNTIIKTLKKRNKTNKLISFIYVLSLFTFISCIIYLSMQALNQQKIEKDNEILKNEISGIENVQNKESEKEATKETDNRIEKVKELQKENPDIVGWLEIVGTNISYPILQGKDNSYYMNHNYKKEKSVDGSLFLDKAYNWEKPSTNLLIYGHNNRGSKEMFVELLKYKDEGFYKEHKNIRFTTATEDAEYEIISAFLSRVYYKHEKDVFRYYYFIDANNKEEFDNYVESCKKASLYNIDVSAEYGDQLITLSTCEYSQEDGRFAVVARKK